MEGKNLQFGSFVDMLWKNILRRSETQYQKGIDSYLSVLDAQRIQYSAKQGFVTLRLAKAANERNNMYLSQICLVRGGSCRQALQADKVCPGMHRDVRDAHLP
jgi:hypothetical protein